MTGPPCFGTGNDIVHGGPTEINESASADVKISNFIRKNHPDKKHLLSASAACRYGASGLFSTYSGQYMNKLSWVSKTSSASLLTTPRDVFDSLFAGYTGSTPVASDPMVQYRLARGKSVLDSVLGQANSLTSKVGSSDKQKLDQFFTSMREVERSIAMTSGTSQPPVQVCSTGTRPAAGNMPFDQEVKAYLDLAVLAMACDRSRVITHFFDPEGNTVERVFPWLGLTDKNHHLYSHWVEGGVKGDDKPFMKITNWYAQQLAYFLGRLQSFKEGDKDVLYNSIIVYGSGHGDGAYHNTHDLPIVIAGEGGGQMKTGQGINASNVELSNMWLSIMKKFGMPDTKHGTSTGLIDI
ncbi:MAG: DUF1552 domain-containing protein [Pseudobdellovibrio sp.]